MSWYGLTNMILGWGFGFRAPEATMSQFDPTSAAETIRRLSRWPLGKTISVTSSPSIEAEGEQSPQLGARKSSSRTEELRRRPLNPKPYINP